MGCYHSCYEIKNKDKAVLLAKCCRVRRYYAYRKSLVKLGFIQWNSDPEEVLKRIKSSNRWSKLDDYELKRGLESHMDFLKEHTSKLGSTFGSSSISEYENLALKRINSEMGSKLGKHLYDTEELLMDKYFHRMNLRSLARECSTQAEKTGIILVEGFLPVGGYVKEHTMLPSLKHAVTHSFMDCIGYLHGGIAAHGKALRLLFGVAAAALVINEQKPRTAI